MWFAASDEDVMLKWGLVFFLLAIPCAVLGVVDTNVATAVMAQILFFANVVVFVVVTFLGSMTSQAGDSPIAKFPRPHRR